MKIGPLTIERAQNAAAKPERSAAPEFGERGATGTQIFGGIVQQQDYNADLQAPQCYDVYDKMRLSDGQVGAALSVIKLPILRANWYVEPASDSAEDRMIAEFCERDIRGTTTSFGALMRQILVYLDYGSYPFEPVWEVRDDGLVHLRKLAPRNPRTIMRWMTDDHGGFAGIQQGAIRSSGFKPIDIPANKLVLFVNELEGSNFRGVSVLRRAYKHWFYKDGHYRIDAIANEKRGVGVDIGTIKAGATDKATLKTAGERALMTLHAHDKQYIVEDEENFTYRLETGGARGGQNAIMATIEHHDLRILRAVIAEFVAMGSGSTGSLAMHKDKTGFFLMALEATSDNVADTTSDYLLRPWVGYNWQVKEYPRMKYSRLDTRDMGGIADFVEKLVNAHALTPGEDTERELRVLGDLPTETRPYTITPPDPNADPMMTDEIAALQQRQVARVRELIAAGKSVDEIRLPYKDELVAAIAGAS